MFNFIRLKTSTEFFILSGFVFLFFSKVFFYFFFKFSFLEAWFSVISLIFFFFLCILLTWLIFFEPSFFQPYKQFYFAFVRYFYLFYLSYCLFFGFFWNFLFLIVLYFSVKYKDDLIPNFFLDEQNFQKVKTNYIEITFKDSFPYSFFLSRLVCIVFFLAYLIPLYYCYIYYYTILPLTPFYIDILGFIHFFFFLAIVYLFIVYSYILFISPFTTLIKARKYFFTCFYFFQLIFLIYALTTYPFNWPVAPFPFIIEWQNFILGYNSMDSELIQIFGYNSYIDSTVKFEDFILDPESKTLSKSKLKTFGLYEPTK